MGSHPPIPDPVPAAAEYHPSTTSQHQPKRSGSIAPGIAFVTGGARGLGNAIAVSFAKEGAAGVVLVDVQDEKTFAEGIKAVEAYGTKVNTPPLHPIHSVFFVGNLVES